MGRIITSFYDFVLYESKMYGLSEDKKESDEKNVNKEINWDFNFESGKFLEYEIGKDSLDQIKNDFKKKILPIVTNTDYIGQVITINLIASTSKVPLGPNAKTGLKNAGYKELTNKGLAGARLDTLESIIEDLLFEYLAIKGDDKENFIKDIKNKVKIKKTPKPNLGPDYKSGVDDKDDTKYKEVQKISSEIEITAEKIEEDRKISCNKSTSGRGTKGEAINNFVGYEKNLYLIAASGDKITIKFDPITVPDCFIYKYTGEYKLSVFSGNFGGILAEPFVQNKFDNLVKLANQGNIIMPEKVNKNGIYYTVLNYKKTINEK